MNRWVVKREGGVALREEYVEACMAKLASAVAAWRTAYLASVEEIGAMSPELVELWRALGGQR